MKIIGHFEDQQAVSGGDGGVDYGGSGKVLIHVALKTIPVGMKDAAKYEGLLLIWRKSSTCWVGRGMDRRYCPAELQAIGGRQDDNPKYHDIMPRIVFEGGRISVARVKAALPKIREAMKGLPIRMEHIDLKKTFVITGIE